MPDRWRPFFRHFSPHLYATVRFDHYGHFVAKYHLFSCDHVQVKWILPLQIYWTRVSLLISLIPSCFVVAFVSQQCACNTPIYEVAAESSFHSPRQTLILETRWKFHAKFPFFSFSNFWKSRHSACCESFGPSVDLHLFSSEPVFQWRLYTFPMVDRFKWSNFDTSPITFSPWSFFSFICFHCELSVLSPSSFTARLERADDSFIQFATVL